MGLACCSYLPTVAPHGTAEPLYGTNPIAFAWPRPAAGACGPDAESEVGKASYQSPLVFDMATSSMALGDVQMLANASMPVDLGVGLDGNGSSTREARAIVDGGVLLPFGGYKGSNVAMAIELLAGPLLGETSSWQTAAADDGCGPPLGGQLLVAMCPDLFSGTAGWRNGGEDFIARLSAMKGAR